MNNKNTQSNQQQTILMIVVVLSIILTCLIALALMTPNYAPQADHVGFLRSFDGVGVYSCPKTVRVLL